jgi:hypothetical protein
MNKIIFGSGYRKPELTSCIEFIKTQFSAKNTNIDVHNGIRSMIDNFSYYQKIQVDKSFMAFLVKYHDAEIRALKNKQKFDAKLNRENTGKLIVLKRVGDILK